MRTCAVCRRLSLPEAMLCECGYNFGTLAGGSRPTSRWRQRLKRGGGGVLLCVGLVWFIQAVAMAGSGEGGGGSVMRSGVSILMAAAAFVFGALLLEGNDERRRAGRARRPDG